MSCEECRFHVIINGEKKCANSLSVFFKQKTDKECDKGRSRGALCQGSNSYRSCSLQPGTKIPPGGSKASGRKKSNKGTKIFVNGFDM